MKNKVPNHGRVKEKYNPKPSTAEIAYREEVRKLGCLVCHRYAAIHHVPQKKGHRRNHYRIVPLCEPHHQGKFGIHGNGGAGSNEKFKDMYGIDLREEAERIYKDSR